jgi:hypothetical protein
MADDINKINDEINKLRKELGKNPLKPFNEKDLETAKALLSGLRAEVRELSSDLDYVAKSFKDSVNELSKQNIYLASAKKSLSSISDISKKVIDYRRGETSLSEKQLKNLQQQAKSKFETLRYDLKSGTLSKANAAEVKNALKYEDEFNEALEKTIKYQKEVNQEIGLLGTGLKGVAGLLSKAGFGDLSRPLNDAIEKTKNARMQTKLNSEDISRLNKEIASQNTKNLSSNQLAYGFGGKNLKNLQLQKEALESQNKELSTQSSKYRNIGESLKEQLTYYNLLDFLLIQIGKAIIAVDKQTGDLAKGFNITYKEANNLRDDLQQMALASGKLTSNTKAYQETILAVGKALGSNAVLNAKDLETFTMLRDAAGFTNEELVQQQKLTFVSGKNLDKNVVSILQSAKATGLNNKLLLNEKDILRDVGNTSNAIKLSLGGGGKALGEAAAQAKALGMNMQQVENIAGSLLNFESSISAELEAELLTGKDLNLEMARLYAINNDMAGVAREIRKNYGSIEEFSLQNRIQQEAAAKAVGMTREELAKTLTDERALNKLSGDDLRLGQAALEFARSKGMTEEQIREKTIEDLRNQMSVQERLNASIEKFKEVFIGIAQIVLPIVSAFSTLVGSISSSIPLLRIMQGLMLGILSRSIATAVANIFGAGARTGNILTGLIFAGLGTAALYNALSESESKAQGVGDMSYSNGTGETLISTKEGGLFKPSPNDDIAVAPGIGDMIRTSNKRKSTPDTYLEERMKDMSNQVSALTANVNKMTQQPIFVSATLEGNELIKFQANRSNEIATQSSKNAWVMK